MTSVGMAQAEDDGVPFAEKMQRLTTHLRAQLAEAEKSAKATEGNLKELEYDLA